MKPRDPKFHHPYDPYSIQLEFMRNLYQCIEDRNIGIFESPTGTGKSLSLICAALTWLRDHERQSLFGNTVGGEELDWLEAAERRVRVQQLLECRKEAEDKLKQIRLKSLKQSQPQPSAKRVKSDDQFHEEDLILEDYESGNERHIEQFSGDETLSSSTLALLNQLRPTKITNEEADESRTKIIFCSRTHSQITQFVSELRKVNVPSGASEVIEEEVTKHVPLASRKGLCLNPKVSRLTSTLAINERCLELQKPGIAKDQRCEFLASKASHEGSERIEKFRDAVLAQVHDIEDVTTLGRKMKLCPYYASRSVVASTEVVTLPYPLLLQKSAREALSLDVKDNIVIIDEAHNLTSAIADTVSIVIPQSHLELVQKQLLGYCQKFKNKLRGKNRVYIAQIIRINKSCLTRLAKSQKDNLVEESLLATELLSGQGIDQIQPHKLVKYIQESKLVYKVEGYAELLDQEARTGSRPDATTHNVQPKGVLAQFQNLLVALMNPASEGRFFLLRQDKETILKYVLLDPQAQFQEIVQNARSVILAGGTMSPMADWADQLFSYVPRDRLKNYSFGHIIDRSNILVQPLSRGPSGVEFDLTFSNRQSPKLLHDLGLSIEKLCNHSPDGMVVFFPSYDYLGIVADTWKRPSGTASIFGRISTIKEIFQESKEASVDDLLRSYTNAVDTGKGAIMLAIVGGKLSEGINFSDRLGRVVVCVGLPYPNIRSAEWRAKVEYIERDKFEKSKLQGLSDHECKARAQNAGRDYADNTTMRAVNQSIGRAIRHKNDYAGIYLVDKRYATPRIQAKLPAWLRDSVKVERGSWKDIESDCSNFFLGRPR